MIRFEYQSLRQRGTARRIETGQAGLLRVSFVGSALLSIVPGIVQRFRRGRPEVQIELRERSTVESLRALSTEVIDIGLVRPPVEVEAELHTEVVLRERTVAAIPAGHPLAQLRRVPLRRLAAEPLVLFAREQAPGVSRPADRSPGRHRDLPRGGSVRTRDPDDHRTRRGRDRRVARAGVGSPTGARWRHLPAAQRRP